MLDSASKIEFLRIGLARYPDARETVDYFETTLMDPIFAAFNAKADWKSFQPRRDSAQALQSGKFIGPADRYIHAWIGGTLTSRGISEKVWLTLGIYWNPSRRPNARAVAASACNIDRGGPVPFADLPGRSERVVIGPLNRPTERRLLLDLGDDFDPAEAFSLLLDAADDALG
jgi:hypothetical protein